MLQLQQRIRDVNMNPNQPILLGQTQRPRLRNYSDIIPKGHSIQLQEFHPSQQQKPYEEVLRNSLLAQSHFDYQEKLQQLMNMQNQLLKQQLVEMENRQLKMQNELLQRQVLQMENQYEFTMKQLKKNSKLSGIKNTKGRIKKQEIEENQINMLSNNKPSFNISGSVPNNKQFFSQPQNFYIQDDSYHHRLNTSNFPPARKLKVYMLAVLAYIRWSKNYRFKRLEISRKLKIVKGKFEIITKKIMSLPEDKIQQLLTEWVVDLFDSVFECLNSEQFINQFEQQDYDLNSLKNIEDRQQLILRLTLNFFDHLEKMTRQEALPTLIINLIFLSLFKNHNIKVSLFVAKRTNFYLKNTVKLGIQQEKLIIGEYLFFQIIITFMINILNYQSYRNLMHEKQCKFYCTIIASIIQIVYMNTFTHMKLVKQINVELYQRKVVIDEALQSEIQEDDSISQDEILILGLHDISILGSLFDQQKQWTNQIVELFQQILQNVHNQI